MLGIETDDLLGVEIDIDPGPTGTMPSTSNPIVRHAATAAEVPVDEQFALIVAVATMTTAPPALDTAEHLRKLLAPGGLLIVIEHLTTREDPPGELAALSQAGFALVSFSDITITGGEEATRRAGAQPAPGSARWLRALYRAAAETEAGSWRLPWAYLQLPHVPPASDARLARDTRPPTIVSEPGNQHPASPREVR